MQLYWKQLLVLRTSVEETKNAHRVLVRKYYEKSHLGDLDKDGKIIMKWILKWQDVEVWHLAEERDKWQALVNTIMNLQVPHPPPISSSLMWSLKLHSVSLQVLQLLIMQPSPISSSLAKHLPLHKYKTRNNNNLHRPIANLSEFNNRAYISGIKVFNHLPQYIKALTNDHKYFKYSLKRFLYHHSFYSMNEYYEYKEDRRI